MSSLTGLGKTGDISKSLALLPKLEAAPLPDWAKKSKHGTMRKTDSVGTLGSTAGAECGVGATRWRPLSLASGCPLTAAGIARGCTRA